MSTESRKLESELMSLFEQIIHNATEAEGFIQDDGKMTGPKDREEIHDRMRKIRSLSIDVDKLIGPDRYV